MTKETDHEEPDCLDAAGPAGRGGAAAGQRHGLRHPAEDGLPQGQRHGQPARPAGAGGDPAGQVRRAPHLRQERGGPVLRAGVRARPGPLLADGVRAPDGRGPPVRAVRQEAPGNGHLPAHARPDARGAGGVPAARRRDPEVPGRLRGRGQRLHPREEARRAGPGVLAAETDRHRLPGRGVEAGAQPDLGQADVLELIGQPGPRTPVSGPHPDGRPARPGRLLRPIP